MQPLKVTWLRAMKIWWSLAWRSVLYGSIAAFVAGLAVGSLSNVLGHEHLTNIYTQSAGLLVGIPVGILVVKMVLSKEFRDYRIVIMPSTEVMMKESLNDITRNKD